MLVDISMKINEAILNGFKVIEQTQVCHRNCYLQSSKGHNLNQRTSGPVNAHLIPGPGIYFNAFIHVYSPRAGADNPLGTNVDVNRKSLSLCPFTASLKKEI